MISRDESTPPVAHCDFAGDGDPGFCVALDTELRSPTSNLVQTWAIDATTGRRFWTGVGRQDGAHVTALNVCPWCAQSMVRA